MSKALFKEELKELEAMLEDSECSERDVILQEIERTQKVLEIIGRVRQ